MSKKIELSKDEWKVVKAIVADRRDVGSIAQRTKVGGPKVRRLLRGLAERNLVASELRDREQRWKLTRRGAGVVRMAG